MGNGVKVRVDVGAVLAGGRRLARTAETLEGLAGRVRTLCAAAGAAAGGAGLDDLLAETGRETARAVGQGASVVGTLGTRTTVAGEDYRLLEQALARDWSRSGSAGAERDGGHQGADGSS
jgi:hypothetical protein